MIERAVSGGLPFAWFTADEAYGDNGPLRAWLEDSKIAYVVAVACDHRVPPGAGRVIRADMLAAKVPGRGWQRMSCWPGSKGERLYDWALAGAGPGHYLLIRRSLTSGELAYYRRWSQVGVTLADLARVAGARWAGLTVNEIRRMHAILCRPAHPPEHHLRWSHWRRRHQARARNCHHQRRRDRDH
jgi:SRSO17 transposase